VRKEVGGHRRPLGEKHALGESIAQRAQRGMGRGRVFGRHRRHLGEKHTLGESIAQRSQRGMGSGRVFGDTGGT
jgi:hypothetical protein